MNQAEVEEALSESMLQMLSEMGGAQVPRNQLSNVFCREVQEFNLKLHLSPTGFPQLLAPLLSDPKLINETLDAISSEIYFEIASHICLRALEVSKKLPILNISHMTKDTFSPLESFLTSDSTFLMSSDCEFVFRKDHRSKNVKRSIFAPITQKPCTPWDGSLLPLFQKHIFITSPRWVKFYGSKIVALKYIDRDSFLPYLKFRSDLEFEIDPELVNVIPISF